MENSGRNVDCLSNMNISSFVPQAHLASTFEDEVDFLLFLVVPGHLPSVGIQSDVSDAEVGGLYRTHPTNEIVSGSACRICSSVYLFQICNNHT